MEQGKRGYPHENRKQPKGGGKRVRQGFAGWYDPKMIMEPLLEFLEPETDCFIPQDGTEFGDTGVIKENMEYLRHFGECLGVMLPQNAENIEQTLEVLCNKYGFSYSLVGKRVLITTRYSKWYMNLDPGGAVLKLFHGNTRKNRGNNFESEYHRQDWPAGNSIAETLNYIYRHDKAYLRRVGRPSRMDYLFSLI
jgi:hypothetical protein